jgi:type I restriction enzyme R subunit
MSTQTTETAFETYVVQMLLAKGWQQGTAGDWDKTGRCFLG